MNTDFYRSTKFWLHLLVVIAIGEAIALLAVIGISIDNSRSVNDKGTLSGSSINTLIGQANQNVYTLQPIFDISSDRAYLPELKVSLPLDVNTRQLVYWHNDASNSSPEEATFNYKGVVAASPQSLADVPCIQKMVRVTVDKAGETLKNEKDGGQVALKDGRTLYIHLNNSDSACKALWHSPYTPNDLAGVLKEAQSY